MPDRRLPTPPPTPGLLECPGELRYFDSPPTTAVLVVREFTAAARWKRAVLAWIGCWGAAVAAVFLPVLHFVLVPTLLFAAPFAARRMFAQRRVLLSVRGRCPACAAALDTTLPGGDPRVQPVRCDACGRSLELHPDTSLLAAGPAPEKHEGPRPQA